MGFVATAKGLAEEDKIYTSCIFYLTFLEELAYLYNGDIGEMFKFRNRGGKLTEDQIKRWTEICNDDLDIFLFHSDLDGKYTPNECRRIYNAIKDFDMHGEEPLYYYLEKMLEKRKKIFLYCARRRVNLYYY